MRGVVAWLVSLLVVAAPRPARFVTEGRPWPIQGALVCRITSEARDERWVRVEAVDRQGRAVFDSGRFRLGPGASFVTSRGWAADRCQFTVEGDPQGVRAHGLLLGSAGEPLSLPPARLP